MLTRLDHGVSFHSKAHWARNSWVEVFHSLRSILCRVSRSNFRHNFGPNSGLDLLRVSRLVFGPVFFLVLIVLPGRIEDIRTETACCFPQKIERSEISLSETLLKPSQFLVISDSSSPPRTPDCLSMVELEKFGFGVTDLVI